MVLCSCITELGFQCKNSAKDGSQLCHTHIKKCEKVVQNESIEDPEKNKLIVKHQQPLQSNQPSQSKQISQIGQKTENQQDSNKNKKLAILDIIFNENKDKIKSIIPHPFDNEKALIWVNSQPEKYKEFCSLFLKHQIHVSGQTFLENIAKLGADIISKMLDGKYAGIIACSVVGTDMTKSNIWVLLLLHEYLRPYIVALCVELTDCYDYVNNHLDHNYLIILPDDMSYSGNQMGQFFTNLYSFDNLYQSTLLSLNNDDYEDDTYISKLVDTWSGFQKDMSKSAILIKKILKLKNKRLLLKKLDYNETECDKIIKQLNYLIRKGYSSKYVPMLYTLVSKLTEDTLDKISLFKDKYFVASSKTDILIAVPFISTNARDHLIYECKEFAEGFSLNEISLKFSNVAKIIEPFDELLKKDGFEGDIPESFVSDSESNQAIYFDHKLADNMSSWPIIYDSGPIAGEDGEAISYLGSLIKNCPIYLDNYEEGRVCPRGFYKDIKYTYLGNPLSDDIMCQVFG